jgi:hypothetical protein
MTKEQTLAALKNQMDSFYTLQQVIDIIEGIDPAPAKTEIDINVINKISKNIAQCLDANSYYSLVDKDSISFHLKNRVIEVVNAEINVKNIMGHINKVLNKYIAKKV